MIIHEVDKFCYDGKTVLRRLQVHYKWSCESLLMIVNQQSPLRQYDSMQLAYGRMKTADSYMQPTYKRKNACCRQLELYPNVKAAFQLQYTKLQAICISEGSIVNPEIILQLMDM